MPDQSPGRGAESRTHRFLADVIELGFVAFVTANAVLIRSIF